MQSPYLIEIELIELICRGVDPRTGEVIRTPREPRLDGARLAYLSLLRDCSNAYGVKKSDNWTARPSNLKNTGAKWAKEDDDCLSSEVARGASVAQLAVQFGRSQGAIWSRLSKLGLVENLSTKSIESSKDLSQKSPQAPRWSKVEVADLLRRWRESGVTRGASDIQELSKIHGRSDFAIIHRLHSLRAVSIEEADALCVAVGAKNLISDYVRDANRPLRLPAE